MPVDKDKMKALALAIIERIPGWLSAQRELSQMMHPAAVLELLAENDKLDQECDELRADAERYRALRDLMQNAKGSASIEVNQHLAYYEECEPGEEVKLQWYPDTPIGFYTIEGATLDAVADEAVTHTKAGKP